MMNLISLVTLSTLCLLLLGLDAQKDVVVSHLIESEINLPKATSALKFPANWNSTALSNKYPVPINQWTSVASVALHTINSLKLWLDLVVIITELLPFPRVLRDPLTHRPLIPRRRGAAVHENIPRDHTEGNCDMIHYRTGRPQGTGWVGEHRINGCYRDANYCHERSSGFIYSTTIGTNERWRVLMWIVDTNKLKSIVHWHGNSTGWRGSGWQKLFPH